MRSAIILTSAVRDLRMVLSVSETISNTVLKEVLDSMAASARPWSAAVDGETSWFYLEAECPIHHPRSMLLKTCVIVRGQRTRLLVTAVAQQA